VSRWRALAPEQRQAAGAAAALVLTLGLPWYSAASLRQSGFDKGLSAFGVFSFVEAAVLLVAAAVLYLLWARSEGRAFHLPGGDGWAVTAGGAWVEFLLVWRLFDKPDEADAVVGVAWGLFVAMAVAAALIAAGQRMRAAHRPEPPNPAEDPTWEVPRRRRETDRPRRPADPHAVTEVLRGRPPAWEGEPPEPPGRARRGAREEPGADADAGWETPPLWEDADAPTRRLPRDEPDDDARPGPPAGHERLF